jgi:hypothetical protein
MPAGTAGDTAHFDGQAIEMGKHGTLHLYAGATDESMFSLRLSPEEHRSQLRTTRRLSLPRGAQHDSLNFRLTLS